MVIVRYFKLVFLVYKFVLIKYLRLNKSRETNIIINHTFGKSFKFSAKDHLDKLFILKFYFKILLFKIKSKPLILGEKLILDVDESSESIRRSYIACFSKEKIDGFLALSELKYFQSYFHKFIFICLTLPLVFLLFILGFFSQSKMSFPLLIEVIVVGDNLLEVLKDSKTVFYFSIYEAESNLFAYLLMKKGIKVVKFPSEVPLVSWNRNILSSTLVICNAYQLEEVKAFSSTIIVNDFLFWGPERYQEIKHLYKEPYKEPPKNTIGFYSSASWVRRDAGDFEPGDLFNNELKICNALNNLLALDKGIELIIFLHPREKNKEYLSKSLAYYKKVFKDKNYKISDLNLPSSSAFSEIDLAVSVGSTLMYERLYSGFKSVFYQKSEDFPIENSTLSNIWMKEESDFLKKMKDSLKITQKEFFVANKITNYSNRYNNNSMI